LIRLLIEIAVASNAPTQLKTQALHSLQSSSNLLNFPLISYVVTPYVPVPETNGEEWDRLEPMAALDALAELVVVGEYTGASGNIASMDKEALQVRAAGVAVFEVPFRTRHYCSTC
jgi:hypothetical protein